MATYLLTWNPKRWQWVNIQDDIAEITNNGYCHGRWSTGVTKKIKPNDRIFMIKLGSQKFRGIMASGWAISEVFQDVHWGDDKKLAFFVDVHFDTIIDPNQEPIFPIELLQDGIYSNMNWTPQSSGISIPDEIVEQLEMDWSKFLNLSIPVRQIKYADEIDETKTFNEGVIKQVKVNAYERNTEARVICIKKYGAKCSVCGFDFHEKYGEIGTGFIHVHHLKPLSEIHEGYELNPINDLRPVCPNCHAMLHQKKPEPYTIEQLQSIIKQTGM